MALVLAIEPDLRQAAVLKRIIREKVKADLVVVDSPDAAMESLRAAIPDVLLLSALLSPRDEDELIAHLRGLDGAEHLQTHTIPQLASSVAEGKAAVSPRGLLKKFRRKKEPEAVVPGCDPELFASEVRTFLQHAADKREERRLLVEAGGTCHDSGDMIATRPPVVDAPCDPPAMGSSWESPFEWRAASIPHPSSLIPHPIQNPESRIPNPASRIADPASRIADERELEDSMAAETADAEAEQVFAAPPAEFVVSEIPISEVPVVAEEAQAQAPISVHEDFPAIAAQDSRPDAVQPVVDQPLPVASDHAANPMPEALRAIDERMADLSPTHGSFEAAEPETAVAGHFAGVEVPLPVADVAPIAVAAAMKADVDDVPVTLAPVVQEGPVTPIVTFASSDLEELRGETADPSLEPPIAAQEHTVEIPMVASEGLGNTDWKRLGPLATWVRAERPTRSSAPDPQPETTDDELRRLMSGLAVPLNVASVAYARGCRIRRVRVPAAKDHRPGDVAGAVILSRKALDAQRAATR